MVRLGLQPIESADFQAKPMESAAVLTM